MMPVARRNFDHPNRTRSSGVNRGPSRPEIPAPPGVGLLGAEVMAVWDGLDADGPQAERLEAMVHAFVREDPEMPRPDLCLLRAGPPAETIVQTAQALDALMVAMATPGRTGVAHFLLGSTAEEVVRRAPCAVLTVKPGDVLALAPSSGRG